MTETEKYTMPARSGCKNLLQLIERDTPRTPEYVAFGDDEEGKPVYDTAYCPNCHHEFETDYDESNFCPDCGQRLDWTRVEEEEETE